MMKKIFSYKSSRKHYKNKEGILVCSDQRFSLAKAALERYLKFAKMADPIVIPGGAILALAKNRRYLKLLAEWISTLSKLHGFKTFYLTMHNECGACGGTTDRAFYEKSLRQAMKALKGAAPKIKFKALFFDFDGVYQVK